MKFREGWSSHLPVLVKVMENSTGDVLELGMGLFSTPLLHWMCNDQGRRLVSYENDEKYFDLDLTYRSRLHEVKLVRGWDDADIENQHWGVVFVDHAPARRRKIELKRIADKADIIICHDTDDSTNRFYRWHWVFPKFKYQYRYEKASPNTTVLSNTVDVARLFGQNDPVNPN